MSDDPMQPVLKVPPEVAQQFPDIIEFIRTSESMNDEERQYWVDILPVMTPEQREQLRNILKNEREQLAAIDAKYAKEIENVGDGAALRKMEKERKSKQKELSAKEASVRAEEEKEAEDILTQLD